MNYLKRFESFKDSYIIDPFGEEDWNEIQPIYIRIIKSGIFAWYKKFIGETFPVISVSKKQYKVVYDLLSNDIKEKLPLLMIRATGYYIDKKHVVAVGSI